MSGQHKVAVVAGAGPVGGFAAILLAQQGWDVQVYERSTLPERVPPREDTKGYLLNLNQRGLAALRTANIDVKILAESCKGSVEWAIYDARGRATTAYKVPVDPEKPRLIRVFRDEVTRHIYDEATRLFPKKIAFHFNSPVASVDLQNQSISVNTAPNGEFKAVMYDLLIGADGANSVVRAAMADALPPDFFKREKVEVVYMTAPAESDETSPNYAFLQGHQFEAGTVGYFGKGGDVRVVLFTDKGVADRLAAGDKDWILQYLKSSMPKLQKNARKAVYELVESGTLNFVPIAGWTHLSQLHGPKVALVGDAAHCMTPALGQGCNAGLEDVLVLCKLLQDFGRDTDKALAAYTKTRLPDIQALLSLNKLTAEQRFQESSRVAIATGMAPKLLLKLHVGLRSALHKVAPNFFGESTFHRVVKGQGRYRDVQRAMYKDAAMVGAAAAVTIGVGIHLSR